MTIVPPHLVKCHLVFTDWSESREVKSSPEGQKKAKGKDEEERELATHSRCYRESFRANRTSTFRKPDLKT